MVQLLAQEAEREESEKIGPWIDTANSSTPVYVVGPDQPDVEVTLTGPMVAWRASLQEAFAAVPIPADAEPAAGPDAEMTIYQPSTDRLWEFFEAQKVSGGWEAGWGGAIDDVSQDPGYYNDEAWSGAAPDWGATATSLPLVGGLMTISELESGQIDHALSIALPDPRAGVYSFPAERGDGTGSNPNALPEGAHLRLSPAVDVAALHLPHLAEMMALAAQRYGIIVQDQTHHGISFYAEDPTPTGSDPFSGPGGLFGGGSPAALLRSFPWSSLQVLQMELHPSG